MLISLLVNGILNFMYLSVSQLHYPEDSGWMATLTFQVSTPPTHTKGRANKKKFIGTQRQNIYLKLEVAWERKMAQERTSIPQRGHQRREEEKPCHTGYTHLSCVFPLPSNIELSWAMHLPPCPENKMEEKQILQTVLGSHWGGGGVGYK